MINWPKIIILLTLLLCYPNHALATPTSKSALDATKISLDFQEVSLRTALQQLAKFIGFNIIIDEQVQGYLSLHLDEVEALQVLDTILQMKGLSKQMIGNTWIILPQTLMMERQNTLQQPPTTLVNKRILIKYRDAQEIAELFLDKNAAPYPAKGKLNVDNRSNSLWIQDTPIRVQMLEELVQAFDHPLQQILIEARIVNIDRNFEQELGIRFGLNHPTTLSGTLSSANQMKIGNSITDIPFSDRLNIDLPVTSAHKAASLGLALINLGSHYLLDLELSALESIGGGQIISSPHLITTDRSAALIEAGSEIPYQESLPRGLKSTTFKRAVLSLNVIPQITDDQHILLQLQLNHDKPSTAYIGEIPAIDTQTIQTQVVVASGETIVLGGIYERLQQKGIRRVPILSQLPILGKFFNHRAQQDKTKELLIFVTPHILKEPQKPAQKT